MVRPALGLLLAGLSACGEDPCPRGSMLDSPQGLVLTAAEHPTGWGEAECTLCHALPSLHRRGCTPDVDVEPIRAEVKVHGIASCAQCHGDNGVQP